MARGTRDDEPAENHGENADRDVDEKDRTPVEATEIGADEHAAEDRTGHGCEAGAETEQRERLAAFFGRERHLRNGQHLRRHHGTGETLQDAGRDQPFDRGRKTAGGRGHGKGRDADQEHFGSPDDVAETAERQQAKGEGQHVGGDHPFDLAGVGAKVLLQAGQRHVDDGDVDQIHEAGDQQHGKRQPAPRIGFRLVLGWVKLRGHRVTPLQPGYRDDGVPRPRSTNRWMASRPDYAWRA